MQLKEIKVVMTAAETAELMELKRLVNQYSSVRHSTSRVVARAVAEALNRLNRAD
jgi:hypothetical protein